MAVRRDIEVRIIGNPTLDHLSESEKKAFYRTLLLLMQQEKKIDEEKKPS